MMEYSESMLPAASPRLSKDSPLGESVLMGIRAAQTAVNLNQTIHEALEDLRMRTIDGPLVSVYALDDDDRLVGQVSARELLFSPPKTLIREVMTSDFTVVTINTSMAEALEVFHQKRLVALPVIDDEGRLVGSIELEQYARESLARAEREHVRQVFQTLGLAVGASEHMTAMESFRMRMPWLCCNLAGGILCALIGWMFEDLLQQVVLLAFFLPLVLTLGESIAMQSVSLAVGSDSSSRSLAHAMRGIRVEAAAALMMGVLCGVLVAVTSLLWGGGASAAMTMFAAVSVSMFFAAVCGGAVPMILQWLRMNPSVAAGPIALVIADTGSLAIYFTLGLLILMP